MTAPGTHLTRTEGLYKMLHKPYLRPVLHTMYGAEALDPTVERKKEADACYNPKNPGLPWLDPCDGKTH